MAVCRAGGSLPCSAASPERPLFLGATVLTAINDNALITYLATLVPESRRRARSSRWFRAPWSAAASPSSPTRRTQPDRRCLGRFFDGAILPIGLLAGRCVPTRLPLSYFVCCDCPPLFDFENDIE